MHGRYPAARPRAAKNCGGRVTSRSSAGDPSRREWTSALLVDLRINVWRADVSRLDVRAVSRVDEKL